jgi:heme exporter protein D
MIDLGPHAVFIVWAYVGVAAAMIALIGWTVLDARRVEKRLADLEAQGVRRRSGPAA